MKRLIALTSAAALCLSMAAPLHAQEVITGAASSSAAGSSAIPGAKTLLIIVAVGVAAVLAGANSK